MDNMDIESRINRLSSEVVRRFGINRQFENIQPYPTLYLTIHYGDTNSIEKTWVLDNLDETKDKMLNECRQFLNEINFDGIDDIRIYEQFPYNDERMIYVFTLYNIDESYSDDDESDDDESDDINPSPCEYEKNDDNDPECINVFQQQPELNEIREYFYWIIPILMNYDINPYDQKPFYIWRLKNVVLKQLTRCVHCKVGGCGWKTDFKPYWFCSPECIDVFNTNS